MNTFFEAMLNGWWQGIVLTGMVWLAMRDSTRIGAATKAAIWQVTMLVVLLLPALQWIGLQSVSELAPKRPLIEISEKLAEVFAAVSIFLALLQVLRLTIGFFAIWRLKRSAQPVELNLPVSVGRPVRVMVSDRAAMPMALGYRKPAILIPRSMANELSAEDSRHILMHEAAHLLRRDDWMKLGERMLRAIFCFQPAVHWIGRQIERERELACDDWVVARSGQTKAYAVSLARVAELGCQFRAPLLATGAGRPKEILERLESLLDRTRNRMPQVSGTLVLSAALALLFVVSQGTEFSRVFGFEGYSNHWVDSDGSRRRDVKMRGDVRFAASDEDVESMSPGARMVIQHSEGGRTRTIDFEADEQSTIVRRYFVDGVARPWNDDATRQLAKVLPEWIREQGENIPERTSRMVKEKGVSGTLDEIRAIRRNDVRRGYLEELFQIAALDALQMERALKIAREMESDSEKRHFLERVGGKYRDAGLDSLALNYVDTIHSNEERRTLLTSMLNRGIDGDGRMQRFLRSVEHLESDQDRARLLHAVLRANGAEAQTVARVLQATATISSDQEKARVLVESVTSLGEDPSNLRSFFTAAESIHSAQDHARVLQAMLTQPKLNPETLREVSRSALMISSEQERKELLRLITERR